MLHSKIGNTEFLLSFRLGSIKDPLWYDDIPFTELGDTIRRTSILGISHIKSQDIGTSGIQVIILFINILLAWNKIK